MIGFSREDIAAGLNEPRRMSLRKRKDVVNTAKHVRWLARTNSDVVCHWCGYRHDEWEADHIFPLQSHVDLGIPPVLVAAGKRCNQERQQCYPYADQLSRLKNERLAASHSNDEIWRIGEDIAEFLLGSRRLVGVIVAWIPGRPVYTKSRNVKVRHRYANRKLKQAGLL